MPDKRLRIFAGPNGSGKSSLLAIIPQGLGLGYYINADEIEKQLYKKEGIHLKHYGIDKIKTEELHSFFKSSSFVQKKSLESKICNAFKIESNKLLFDQSCKIKKDYLAAIIADFIRVTNLSLGNSFSFETVMSHSSKIDFIKMAKLNGYKVYLYFVCTEDVAINIGRVKARVKEGGHNVVQNKIKQRYVRSLDLLHDAVSECYKSYLFDNSFHLVEVARIDRDGTIIASPANITNWFFTYLIDKI